MFRPHVAIVALAAIFVAVADAATAAGAEPPRKAFAFDAEITVAAGVEQRLAESGSSVVVLDEQALAAAGALALDDVLRQIPGFTLFRRTGSRAANPTTQGVSLRGAGASGAGRATVLLDGVPLGDPFGGWVAWGRVPSLGLERVEVLRGGGAEVHGSGGLGGVVALVRRRPGGERLVAEASAGELGTGAAGLWLAHRGEQGAVTLAGEGLATRGYFLLDRADRGAVDTRAGVEQGTLELGLERELTAGRLVLRAAGFSADRDNGTRLQENATELAQLVAGLDALAVGGDLSLRLDGLQQSYEQTFTAVAPGRDSERLTRAQRVPSRTAGASLRWTRPLGDRHRLVAGAEGREVTGESDESVPGSSPLRREVAGGSQTTTALHVEDLWQVTPRLSVAAAVRVDRWRNDPGPQSGVTREATATSPRLSLAGWPRDDLGWTLSVFRGFRAPTLNELYRGFRVGDVVTLPNAALAPERSRGIEAGLRWGRGGASARLVAFQLELEDTIANVTVDPGQDGELVLRQRRNLGATRSRGLELEADRSVRGWTLAAGFLATDARVRAAAAPELVGRRLPQVPRGEATLQLRRDAGAFRGGVQLRRSGSSFEDDRNTIRLDGYTTVDGRVEWTPAAYPGAALFLAGENLLDRRHVVGRTPLATWSSPRLLRVGLRWTIAAR